jgi:hypothetical protein
LPDKTPRVDSRWESFEYSKGKAVSVPESATYKIQDNEEAQKWNGLNRVALYDEDLIRMNGPGGGRGGGVWAVKKLLWE